MPEILPVNARDLGIVALSLRSLQPPTPENPRVAEGHKPLRAQRSKNSRFRARLKFSSENENFERATHRSPIFCEEFETSRLKFSSEIKNFDRDRKSSEIEFF